MGDMADFVNDDSPNDGMGEERPRRQEQCLICKETHKNQGQQTRSPWQIAKPGVYVICRRCCEAGKDARRKAEREANDAGGSYFDNFIDGTGR